MTKQCSLHSLPALAVAAMMLLTTMAFAQSDPSNPIDRLVTDHDLTAKYKRDSKSDNNSNVEFKIDNPIGNADSAIGTVFSRAGESYRIKEQVQADEATYDEIKSRQFLRYLYPPVA